MQYFHVTTIPPLNKMRAIFLQTNILIEKERHDNRIRPAQRRAVAIAVSVVLADTSRRKASFTSAVHGPQPILEGSLGRNDRIPQRLIPPCKPKVRAVPTYRFRTLYARHVVLGPIIKDRYTKTQTNKNSRLFFNQATN